jgi:Tol biopolymer transport system component
VSRAHATLRYLAIAVWALTASFAGAQTGIEWHESTWQLWRIGIDGSGLTRLAKLPNSRCGSPVWSPDGKWIAFDVSRAHDEWYQSEIAVISADGAELHYIGAGAVPSWSPDSRLIACHVALPTPFIVVMNRDGSGREEVQSHGWGARWLPRDKRIVTSTADGDGLSLLDLRTAHEQPLFTGRFLLRHGYAVSPDGKRITFSTTASPCLGLATLNDDLTQASVRWLLRHGISYHSSWSPDARHIIFAWRENEQVTTQLYMLDVDAEEGTPNRLLGQDLNRNNVNPDWSPDGKSIVFSSPEAFNE